MAYGRRKSSAFEMKSPLNNGKENSKKVEYNKFGHRIMDKGELDGLSSVSLSSTSTGSNSGPNLVASKGAVIGTGSFSGGMQVTGDKGLAYSTMNQGNQNNSPGVVGVLGSGAGKVTETSSKNTGTGVANNFRMKGVKKANSPLGFNSPLNNTKEERLARTKENRQKVKGYLGSLIGGKTGLLVSTVMSHLGKTTTISPKNKNKNPQKPGKEIDLSGGDIVGQATGTGKADIKPNNFRMKGVGPTQKEPKSMSVTPNGNKGGSSTNKGGSTSSIKSGKDNTTGGYLSNAVKMGEISLGSTKLNVTPMPKFDFTVNNARSTDYNLIRDKGRGRSSRLNTRLDKSRARTANRVDNSLDRIENRQQKSGMRYEKRNQAKLNKAENIMKGREAISGAGAYSQAQKNLDAFEKSMESPKATPRTSGAGNIKANTTVPKLRTPKYQETTTKNSSFNPYKGRQSSGKVEDVAENNKSTKLGVKTKSKVSMSGGRSTKELTKTAKGGKDFNYTIPSVFTRS